MRNKEFAAGAIKATGYYLRAIFTPATLLIFALAATGTSWIERVLASTETWGHQDWAKAIFTAAIIILFLSGTRSAFRAIRDDQRKEAGPAMGAARLMQVGDEIPTPMRPAWLKIARGPGGSGYADWVIAKSGPNDGYDQLMEYAEHWRQEWNPTHENRDESVAWHEAGHAIAAQALGFTVLKATIVPWQNLAGRVEHCNPLPRIAEHMVAWHRTIIALAGQAVDHERSVHDGGSVGDMEQAVAGARLVASIGVRPAGYDGELSTDAILAGARDSARDITRRSANLVGELGARLLDEKTLGNHAMRDILDRVPAWEPNGMSQTSKEPVSAGKV